MVLRGSSYSTSVLLMVLISLLVLRTVSLYFNNSELFFDEAQYWFWAQDLQFGYFSKPPVLAWIISASTQICGSDTAFCVRLFAPVIHTGTAFMIFLAARQLFDQRTGFWSAIAFVTLPATSLSSGIISTDIPLLLFWSIALYAYVRLWKDGDGIWVLVLAIVLGLGLNSKYAMVYFVGCAMIHAVTEQQKLTPPRGIRFWLGVMAGIAMLIPNLIWNLANDFVTVSHTGDNIGWQGFNPNWQGLGEFLGSQFAVFGPILFGVFLATILRMWSDSVSASQRFLLSFSLPVLALITIQAVISKAYANWAATAYIAATILVVEILLNRISFQWFKVSFLINGLAAAVLAVAVCFAAPGQLVLPGGIQPFERTQGASLIAAEAEKILDSGEYNALITTDRKLSALMQYNLRHREEAILAWRPGKVARDHFQLVAGFQDSPRDPAIAILRQDNVRTFRKAFGKITRLGEREIAAGEIERVYFYLLEDHKSFR